MFWRACLLIIPVGFDPRPSVARGRYNVQVRTKFQIDFTHLSEGDWIFYINNKLKNKIFNQVQAWVKAMTEREFFSVQRFFDQLILVYDNFQSMEIVAKESNKMK